MSKKTISNVIDIMAVARDSYKGRYKEHLNRYNEQMKTIKDNYKPGTPFFNEEKKKAKEEFEAAVNKERVAVKNFVNEAVEDLRQDEIFKVRQIDSEVMNKLNAVKDLPLSAEELSILRSRFAKNGEYWPTRFLAVMAEKNGLRPSQFENSASLHTKFDILGQLETQLDNLLSGYNGDFHYRTEVLLCDSALQRAERTFLNGWENAEMEDEQVARRAFSRLKNLSIIEQGIALQNLMSNTTPELKKAFFYEMARNEGSVEVAAMRWAGIETEFEAYKNGDYKDYSEARKWLDKTRVAKSETEVAEISDALKDNSYYMNMLKRESESNPMIADYLNKEALYAVNVENSKTSKEIQVTE